MTTTALLFLSLILPGAGLAKRIVRDFPELKAEERILLVLLLSFVQVCLVCFLHAVGGTFTFQAIWLSLFGLSLFWCLVFYRDLLRSPFLPKDSVRALGLLLVMFLAWMTFDRPAEWMTNMHMDAGRYSNIAGLLQHHGTLKTENKLLPETNSLHPKQDLSTFPGFFRIKARPEITYAGPYLHLYPALLAFVRMHVDLPTSFQMNWLLSLLSAGAFYLLIRQTLGSSSAAALGALLLFSNGACQLYFNRNMSETLTQCLLLFGFVLLTFYYRRPQALFAILAAIVLATLAVCRLEFGVLYGLIPLTLVAYHVLTGAKIPPKLWLFFTVYLLVLIPLDCYYDNIAFVYLAGNVGKTLRGVFRILEINFADIRPAAVHLLIAINGVLIVFAAGLLGLWRWLLAEKQRRVFFQNSVQPWLPAAAAILFALFLAWNLFVRAYGGPIIDPALRAGYDHEQINLHRLLYFLDPLTFVFAILGSLLVFRKPQAALFAIFAVGLTCLSIVESGHSAPVLWWVRRYVPVALPMFYFLFAVTLSGFRPRWQAAFCVLPLAFNLVSTHAIARGYVEKEGSYAFFKNYAEQFSPNDLQLCVGGESCGEVAVPVQSHFGVRSLYLTRELNQRKLALLQQLEQKEGRLLLTHAAQTESPYTKADRRQLEQAGLRLVLRGKWTYKVQEPWTLANQWNQQRSWKRLFVPASLFGLEFQPGGFHVKLFEIVAAQSETK